MVEDIAHGFIFLEEISPSTLYEARKCGESFSDGVFFPSPEVCYGSLAHTSRWFKDKSHLHDTVVDSIANNGLRIVFSQHLFSGFFYGHHLRQGGIFFADGSNLDFLRFLKLVSWEQWLMAAWRLLELLALPPTRKKRCAADLKAFCERMVDMRFAVPYDVPGFLTQAELVRRFGHFVAAFWSEWRRRSPNVLAARKQPALVQSAPASDSEFSLKKCDAGPNPLDFISTSAEVFPDRLEFDLRELRPLLSETFFACLKNVAQMSTFVIKFGLQDFRISVRAAGGLYFESRHGLMAPVYERDAFAERIFEQILNNLQLRLQSSATDETRVVPSVFERVEIHPLAIHVHKVAALDIFEQASDGRSLPEVAAEVSVKGDAKVFLYELAGNLQPEKSYCTVPSGTFRLYSPTDDKCEVIDPLFGGELFQHQYRRRPSVTFRVPLLPFSGHDLSTFNSDCQFRFSENVGNDDYFVLGFSGTNLSFWVKSPVSSRHESWKQRHFTLLGCFSATTAMQPFEQQGEC